MGNCWQDLERFRQGAGFVSCKDHANPIDSQHPHSVPTGAATQTYLVYTSTTLGGSS